VANLFGKVKPEAFRLIKVQLELLESVSVSAMDGIEKEIRKILAADGYAEDPASYLAWWLITVARDVTYESPEEVVARHQREKAVGSHPLTGILLRTGADYELEKKRLKGAT
jgi:hypothetical protein